MKGPVQNNERKKGINLLISFPALFSSFSHEDFQYFKDISKHQTTHVIWKEKLNQVTKYLANTPGT